jgi:ribosomal protein L13
MRTYTPKPGEVTRAWHVIDATDVVLGRLASQTAVAAARQAQADLRAARRHR